MAQLLSYIDCPTHGDAQPAIFDGSRWYCAGCPNRDQALWGAWNGVTYRTSKPRKIELRGKGLNGRPCSDVCTSGKRSCDCKCKGRCHGLGKCLGGH